MVCDLLVHCANIVLDIEEFHKHSISKLDSARL